VTDITDTGTIIKLSGDHVGSPNDNFRLRILIQKAAGLSSDVIIDFIDEIGVPASVGRVINRESSCVIIGDLKFVSTAPLDPLVLAISAQKALS
jgi:hypothetical protein